MAKIILDLCGGTGSWSKPYKDAGYDVRVITLPKHDVKCICFREHGKNGKYIEFENKDTWKFERIDCCDIHGILAAPPCTEFSIAKHFHGKGNYSYNTEFGLSIVYACQDIIRWCDPKFWALENPATGTLSKYIGKPCYVFDAWEFGDLFQKSTALWGNFNFPKKTIQNKPFGIKKFSLLKTKEIEPEYYGIYDRTTRRAMTSKYFAEAFFKANK